MILKFCCNELQKENQSPPVCRPFFFADFLIHSENDSFAISPSQKVPLHISNAVLTTLTSFFRSKSPYFYLKNFSPKFSSGHVEYSYENSAKKFFFEIWKFSSLKSEKKPWTYNLFCRSKFKKTMTFFKISFPQYVPPTHRECSFNNPQIFFAGSPKIVSSNFKKNSCVTTFQKKVSPKMFFWTRRTQFWQLCQKHFAQSPEKIQKFQFFPTNLWNLSTGHGEPVHGIQSQVFVLQSRKSSKF